MKTRNMRKRIDPRSSSACSAFFLPLSQEVLSDLVVNALQFKRPSAVINEQINDQDLAVGRQRQLSGDASGGLPVIDLVFNENASAVGEPRRLTLTFGVRRRLGRELSFSTVERVFFVDRDFAPRAFLLRVEFH